MDRTLVAVAVGALAIIGAVSYYFWQQSRALDAEPAAPPPAVRPAEPPAEAEPRIEHPLPPPPEGERSTEPLPPLAESDPAVREAIAEVAGQEAVEQYVVPEGIVGRIVATVDNLPRRKLAVRLRPVQPVGGTFAVTEGDYAVTLDPRNYARYAPLVKLVQAADTGRLVSLYVRFYPLFQQAYEELGYPDGYFNDRLIEVIDHLLAAPEVKGPIRLTQPRVFYEFADPELEAASAGHKLLIRMGPENAAAIKAKLRELREAIASQQPPRD